VTFVIIRLRTWRRGDGGVTHHESCLERVVTRNFSLCLSAVRVVIRAEEEATNQYMDLINMSDLARVSLAAASPSGDGLEA
jgi:hypothetical protein